MILKFYIFKEFFKSINYNDIKEPILIEITSITIG